MRIRSGERPLHALDSRPPPEPGDTFDSAAEEALAQNFSRRIFVMALCRTHDPSAAQDLAQDALLASIEALRAGRLRDPEKLAAFVFGTARNVINNFVRSRSQAPAFESLVETAGADGSQVLDLESSERLALVTVALAQLNPGERQILEMTLVEGSEPDEIASRLGLLPEAVRQRKCRALKKIVEIVQKLSRR